MKNRKKLQYFFKMIKTENNYSQRNKIFSFLKTLDKLKEKEEKYCIKTDINTNK